MKWIDNQDDYFLRQPEGSQETSDTTNTTGQFSFTQEETSGQATGNDTSTRDDEAKLKADRARRRRRRRRWTWFFLIVLAVLAVAFYIRYYIPYTSDTLTTGYINVVEKRGIFFKTFEGEMISESTLSDTTKVYSRDFYFSIPNDSLGRVVQSYQNTGKRVTITTQKYFGVLPWRGSQKTVLTAIRPAS